MKYKHKRIDRIASNKEHDYYLIKTSTGEPKGRISAIYIEDSCDWEKIEEKTYEILSLRSTANADDCKLKENGLYLHAKDGAGEFTLETLLDLKFLIWTVRRLSDGEIFTVGDSVAVKTNDGMYEQGGKVKAYNITGFEKLDEIITVHAEDTFIGFEYIIPYTPPKAIFTTSDGKDIFLGDKYCFVWKYKEEFHISPQMTADETSGKEVDMYFSSIELAKKYVHDNTKYLLTVDGVKLAVGATMYYITKDFVLHSAPVFKEHIDGTLAYPAYGSEASAREYILWNKPCLSLNDVLGPKAGQGDAKSNGYIFRQNKNLLVKLAKEKQNG